jgi:hypothetical protein
VRCTWYPVGFPMLLFMLRTCVNMHWAGWPAACMLQCACGHRHPASTRLEVPCCLCRFWRRGAACEYAGLECAQVESGEEVDLEDLGEEEMEGFMRAVDQGRCVRW